MFIYFVKNLIYLLQQLFFDLRALLFALSGSVKGASRTTIRVDLKEGLKCENVTFGGEIRNAVVGKIPGNFEFKFEKPVKATRIQFGLSFRDLGKYLKLKNYSLFLNAYVVSELERLEYQYKLPLEGPLDQDWTNGLCGYLTKYWGDHTIDLGKERLVKEIHFHIDAGSSNKSKLSPIQARSLRPHITVPDIRGLARKTKERRSIVVLCFESWVDPLFLRQCYGSDPLSEKYIQILEDFNQFEGGIAQSDWTFPCASSNIYGLYALQHGFTNPAILKSKNHYHYKGSTVAGIAKSAGFKTFAGVFSTKYGPNLGLSKDFDSYEHDNQAVALLNPLPPNSNVIIKNLEKFDQDDCFIFVHTDLLHAPHYAISESLSRNIPAVFPELQDGRLKNPDTQYLRNLRLVYLQIFNLMDYLKVTGQFENTMIILLGDHGFDLQNWYECKRQYPLRESRIRVPYAVHWPQWSEYNHLNGKKESKFREANIGIIKDVCKVLGKEFPEPTRYLIDKKFGLNGYCISESIDHPNVGDYFMSIRGVEDKYVLRATIDWNKCEMNPEFDQYLFPIAKEELTLNSNMIAGDSQAAFYQDLALNFIQENLKFRKQVIPDLICKE